jgi:hypothetical protein
MGSRAFYPYGWTATSASISRCIMDNAHCGLFGAGMHLHAQTCYFPCKATSALPVVTLAAGTYFCSVIAKVALD